MLSLTDCGCDHECSAGDEESFDCVCREGYILKNDGKTCREWKQNNSTQFKINLKWLA